MEKTEKNTMKYMLFCCEDKDFYSFYRESTAGSGITKTYTAGSYDDLINKLEKDTQKFLYVEFDGGLIPKREYDVNVEPMSGTLVKKIIEELKEQGITNIIE